MRQQFSLTHNTFVTIVANRTSIQPSHIRAKFLLKFDFNFSREIEWGSFKIWLRLQILALMSNLNLKADMFDKLMTID